MSNPILVEQGGFSIPLIVSFSYACEDRRPDLDELSAKKVLGYKYKTCIRFKFFGYYRSLTISSLSLPCINSSI